MAAEKRGRRFRKSPLLPLAANGIQGARHNPKQNHLLGSLPARDYARLAPHLELEAMKVGDVLYESGVRLQHVYFPTTAIVSLMYVMENGSSAEIAIVGNDGIVGISLFMGVRPRLAAPSSNVRDTPSD